METLNSSAKVNSYPQLGLILNEDMNWEEHITKIIGNANKKMVAIWKLSNDTLRYAMESRYFAYIRPQLEYASVIYQNCTRDQSNRLKHIKKKQTVACTRAYQRTCTNKLLLELGCARLEEMRMYFSLILLYEMANGLTPGYITSLLPNRQGANSRYPTRRGSIYSEDVEQSRCNHKRGPLHYIIQDIT